MNKFKVLTLCISMLLAGFSFAQIQKNGTAHAVIDVGSDQYAILSIDGENVFYKTSMFSNGLIVVDQSLILEFEDADDTTPEVLLPSRNAVFAFPLESSNSGNFVIPLDNAPDIYMGMLVFEDVEHCETYYNDMREFVDDTLGDADDKLNAFEEYFEGYQSYRTYFNNKYDFENMTYDNDHIQLIEEEDFLNDEVVKTLVNLDRMVIIGDSVLYYHDFHTEVYCHIDDNESITAMIEFPDEGDVFTEPFDALAHRKGIRVHTPLVITSQTKDSNEQPEAWKVTSSLRVQNEECEPLRRKVSIHLEHFNWVPQANDWNGGVNYWLENPNTVVDLTIDWGDGNIEHINQYEGEWITHDYAATGNYTVSTTTDVSYSGHGILNDSKSFDVTSVSCTQQDAQKWGQTQSGAWKITTKLWLNDNSWGNHYGAYTHAWKHQGGSEWKRQKTHLRTIIDGTLRNDSCQPTNAVYGEKDRLNNKKVEKVKTKLFNHYDIANYDIKSVHLLWDGNTHINYSYHLTPCN
ncbi:MAG: hypothetical protein NXI10_05570 [bacterium]|nr:hypothetical protein [bacterium]